MHRTPRLLAVLALIATRTAGAEHGPIGWRGDGSGHFPDAHPPLHWSVTENVRWKTPLPAPAASSPIVVGDRVCVTAEPATVLCASTNDGRVLWRRDIGWLDTAPVAEQAKARAEAAEAARLDEELRAQRATLARSLHALRRSDGTPQQLAAVRALERETGAKKARLAELSRYLPPASAPVFGNAGATPISDGNNLFVIFGNDLVASLSLDGALRWARHLPDPEAPRGLVRPQLASPRLADGLLIAPLSRLHALDPDTGDVRWSGPRYPELGTPAIARLGGVAAIFTPDGNALRLHDGKLLAERLGRLVYVGPIGGDGRLFFVGAYESGGATGDGLAGALALALPASADTPFAVREIGRIDLPPARHFAAPLRLDGRIIAVDRNGELLVIDEATWKLAERRRLGIEPVVRSSVVAAGDHLFLSNDAKATTTVVLEARPPFREVARNTLPRFTGTPFFAGDRMYVRTDEHLFCVGATP